MWIISKSGFVSLVQDRDDPAFIRARARRREHLLDTFTSLTDTDIIDLGDDAPDYRWHASLPRVHVAQAMYDTVLNDVTYDSHVKEEVSGTDNEMYSAMLACWTALYRLQKPENREGDWWSRRYGDWDDSTLRDHIPNEYLSGDSLLALNERLASQMLDKGTRSATFPGTKFPGWDDDEADEPLPVKIWGAEEDICIVCGEPFASGDEYVTLPMDEVYGDPEGPAHAACAELHDFKVARP
jgi:hypothetical protein